MSYELRRMSETWMLVFLFTSASIAGFVDAVAGGGGLITVPALLSVGLNPYAALATNKAQSVWGSLTAMFRYHSSGLIDRSRALSSAIAAIFGAMLGVEAVQFLSPENLRPVVLILLVAVAIFTLFYRAPTLHQKQTRSLLLTLSIAFLIGAYDGFFGPGTGTFLILAHVIFWGDNFVEASAHAKATNFASNFGALLLFILKGWVVWKVAAPMIAGQIVGGFLGAHTTLKVGPQFVRVTVSLLSLILICRLFLQLLGS